MSTKRRCTRSHPKSNPTKGQSANSVITTEDELEQRIQKLPHELSDMIQKELWELAFCPGNVFPLSKPGADGKVVFKSISYDAAIPKMFSALDRTRYDKYIELYGSKNIWVFDQASHYEVEAFLDRMPPILLRNISNVYLVLSDTDIDQYQFADYSHSGYLSRLLGLEDYLANFTPKIVFKTYNAKTSQQQREFWARQMRNPAKKVHLDTLRDKALPYFGSAIGGCWKSKIRQTTSRLNTKKLTLDVTEMKRSTAHDLAWIDNPFGPDGPCLQLLILGYLDVFEIVGLNDANFAHLREVIEDVKRLRALRGKPWTCRTKLILNGAEH